MDERLSAQLAFLLEADRLKQIERQSLITGSRRRENTAEHSWHLALFALVLGEHADEDIDLSRVVALVVLHDLVEIDAGDTYAYDDAGYATKVDREQHAADRLFGLLPDDQGAYLRGLWEEYEAAGTPDARFANALDRLQPVLLNHATDGETWAAHGVTADRVRARNSVIAQGSAGLWAAALARINDAVAQGWISEPE
jgi:putative hydrolase of HD superfamily